MKRYEMNAGKILANHIIKETENAASESPKGDSGFEMNDEQKEILHNAMKNGLRISLTIDPSKDKEDTKSGMKIEMSGTGAALMAGIQTLALHAARTMVASGATQDVLLHYGAGLFTTVLSATEGEEGSDEEH